MNVPFLYSHSNVYDATTKLNSNQFDPERFEVNQLLKSQNERLKLVVQEYRRRQLMTLLKNKELDFSYILAQKDEQIAQVTNINLELREYSIKLETDNQLLRRIAHENESMVLSLNNALEHMKRKTPQDIESCCDMRVLENDVNMICKGCHRNESSFMFLPCGHLCSCEACEDSLRACPVCLVEKKTSIETLPDFNESPKGPLQCSLFDT